ncbi:uncharacterized protein LOC121265264 [Juglans microcarpa x Juglans regia]|uniref:uncharacterized protein LOC121265264 n=1 Tax=Juglans microcarpa x Juglans regia TaxID=2249226 RepID=UPI001B7EFA2D|nr:uncharacterized protein LOC121265264 [Juglans microcarpa x Juglans regia]
MGTLRNCSNCDKRSTEKGILPNSLSRIDMLSWTKGLALDPHNPKASQYSSKRLCNQTLKVRKFLFSCNGESPPRKKKFERFVEGTKLRVASSLAPRESDIENLSKLGNTRFSSVSRSLNSGDTTESCNQQTVLNSHIDTDHSTLSFEDNSQGRPVNIDIISLEDGTKCSSTRNDLSHLNINMDGWVEELATQDTSLMDISDLVESSDSSSSEDPNLKSRKVGIIDSVQKPRSVADFIHSAVSLISGDDHLPRRPVVPIGSKFQAEVPEWRRHENESENLKWLGTRVWPMESQIKETSTMMKAVGKGRRNSCSCAFPKSVDCIKRHVLLSRLVLESEVGPAFFSWKFDEMGEVVSKSWTLKEQRRFESLVKKNPLSGGKNFWELASKQFPSKSKKNILSYYYNVYIPRRMRMRTRSSLDESYSDDDQAA